MKVGDMIITSKQEVKYLEGVLDSKLTGVNMDALVHSKICSRIKFLARQVAVLDFQILKMLSVALM